MNSAGARPTTACQAVGVIDSRTRGSRSSTSAASPQIKFRPKAVGHDSEDCFDYSPNNPKSTSGSGLLGTGARGERGWRRRCATITTTDASRGVARPSNVIEVQDGEQPGIALRSVPARAGRVLPEGVFRCRRPGVRSVPGKRNHDGRGARAGSGRLRLRDLAGLLRRDPASDQELTGEEPVLVATGQSLGDVAEERGITGDQVENPRAQDSRRIQHDGVRPNYGPRRKAS